MVINRMPDFLARKLVHPKQTMRPPTVKSSSVWAFLKIIMILYLHLLNLLTRAGVVAPAVRNRKGIACP